MELIPLFDYPDLMRQSIQHRISKARSIEDITVYYNVHEDEPDNSWGGCVIAVSVHEPLDEREGFQPGRKLKEYERETIRVERPSFLKRLKHRHSQESLDTLWVILHANIDDLKDGWEACEGDIVGASRYRSLADNLHLKNHQAGNTIMFGFPDGWIYGLDPLPEPIVLDPSTPQSRAVRYSRKQ